ncbi:TRAM, LAG1 and CLN8 (TLC) lipid-sensing domain containing protein [Carex rostrata]
MDMEIEDDYYVVKWIISGVVFWTTAFLMVRNLLPKRSFDFCTRIVATMHATCAVCLASFSVQDWTCPVCPLASRSSPLQMRALAVTLSYMIYDLIATISGDNFTVDNAVHHLVSIVGIGAGLAYQKCGTEMVATLWITEMSTPLLHTREFLKELGIRDTDLNLLVDIMFAVIFSLARMGVGPYLTFVTLRADNPFLIKATAFGLQAVSTFWFYKILRMVKYKLRRRSATPTPLPTPHVN